MPRFELHPQDIAFSFLALLFEAIPFLLFGSLISGLIEAFVPARWITRVLPKQVFVATVLSAFLGLIFPMCECGVVPVIRRLIKKGLPVSSAVTYMLSAPVINPVVMFSTYIAFTGRNPELLLPEQMLGFRVGLTLLIAIGVGLFVSRLRPEQFLAEGVLATLAGPKRRTLTRLSSQPAADAPEADFLAAEPTNQPEALAELERELEPGILGKLRVALARGAADFLDVALYLVIGGLLTSIFNTSVPREALEPFAANPWTSTFGMMGLAFALALCSTSDAFVAATFTTFPFSAKLAFLTLGPMLDVKLIFLYRLVFRPRFIAGLALALVLIIGLVCVRLSAFLPLTIP